MGKLIDRVVNLTLTAAVLIVVAVLVRRELRPAKSVAARQPAPRYLERWRDALPGGRLLMGSPAAPVLLVEFGDFECPFCRRLAPVLEAAEQAHQGKVGVIYVHYPLESHRFARPAARAAECAALQSRFRQFHDALFHKQDSLGLKSWAGYCPRGWRG